MHKQKLILAALKHYTAKVKALRCEREELQRKEDAAFDHFLATCESIHHQTFWQSWKEVSKQESDALRTDSDP